MSIMTRPVQPVADCALPHHRPGRRVRWNEHDRQLGRTVLRRSVVTAHRGDIRFIALQREDGTEIRMSCGAVAPEQQ